MYTMNRCNKPHFPVCSSASVRRLAAATLCAALAMGTVPAAVAQVMEHSVARNFPPASKRGDLVVASTVEAKVDSDVYRLAPGLRIFNQQNQLVFAHSVIGQKLDVRYLIEPSTGMLQTAWILTSTELAKEPKRGWFK